MRTVPNDAALLDVMYDEDALDDEDARLGRELPPQAWRVAQREVDDVLTFTRLQLELAWREVREQARRERPAQQRAGRHGSAGDLEGNTD